MDKFVLVFLDDILIYSKNEEEREENLRMNLQLLKEHKLYAKLSKCDFYKYKIDYLGHIISSEEISVDPKKIEAIMDWPTPVNVTDVRDLWDLQDTTGDSLKDSPRLHIQSLLCKIRE